MEKVIYSNNGGLGIILNSSESERDFIIPKTFKICGEEIKPGTMTNLFGLFTKPIRFVGSLIDDKNCMCFELGKGDADLFDQLTYYSCFYWITENRLANKYREHTVRDFNFINGKWK